MGKNKSSGSGSFFQHQSHLGFSGIGGGQMAINSFDERMLSNQQRRDRMDYERAALMQQQRHIEYNSRITESLEKELVEQELVQEDEEIYYLLT